MMMFLGGGVGSGVAGFYSNFTQTGWLPS